MTKDEEYTFLKMIALHSWEKKELLEAVNHGFPELALYMQAFTFDERNTRLSEKDAAFREMLTSYFQRYKEQKLRNQIDEEFLPEVERNAKERPFFKLQPRSAIVSNMDKNYVQAYFFDALGVEYLAYIRAKCEEYGLLLGVQIGRCELPSITVKNKEFKQYFETKDIGRLDELKHHSQIYDYTTCKYPIHIFRELEIIDEELQHIRTLLLGKAVQRAVVISDHGASRLAVLYGQENASSLELSEKGMHSGRCCPCKENPEIQEAAFEDGFAVLGNYERFRGGRRANLEVHGGASLEEVVIPVLTISLKPANTTYHFMETVLRYKMGKPLIIKLFCNVPMQNPGLKVEGTFYRGILEGDGTSASFILTEIKKTREYKAEVYEGDLDLGISLVFRVERNTKANNLF